MPHGSTNDDDLFITQRRSHFRVSSPVRAFPLRLIQLSHQAKSTEGGRPTTQSSCSSPQICPLREVRARLGVVSFQANPDIRLSYVYPGSKTAHHSLLSWLIKELHSHTYLGRGKGPSSPPFQANQDIPLIATDCHYEPPLPPPLTTTALITTTTTALSSHLHLSSSTPITTTVNYPQPPAIITTTNITTYHHSPSTTITRYQSSPHTILTSSTKAPPPPPPVLPHHLHLPVTSHILLPFPLTTLTHPPHNPP